MDLDSRGMNFYLVFDSTSTCFLTVWLHVIRFSFSKKANKEQTFSFSFSKPTEMKKGY